MIVRRDTICPLFDIATIEKGKCVDGILKLNPRHGFIDLWSHIYEWWKNH